MVIKSKNISVCVCVCLRLFYRFKSQTITTASAQRIINSKIQNQSSTKRKREKIQSILIECPTIYMDHILYMFSLYLYFSYYKHKHVNTHIYIQCVYLFIQMMSMCVYLPHVPCCREHELRTYIHAHTIFERNWPGNKNNKKII